MDNNNAWPAKSNTSTRYDQIQLTIPSRNNNPNPHKTVTFLLDYDNRSQSKLFFPQVDLMKRHQEPSCPARVERIPWPSCWTGTGTWTIKEVELSLKKKKLSDRRVEGRQMATESNGILKMTFSLEKIGAKSGA